MTEGLNNMAAIKKRLGGKLQTDFLSIPARFWATKYEFHQRWGFINDNIFSSIHQTDLKLAGHKLDTCTMFSLAVRQMLSSVSR